jgi:MSHA biogenesis protein MshP
VSLVAALFLLVVLAALGAVAARVGVMQQQTAGFDLRAAEALHAAGSGIAWAAYRALDTGWCGTDSVTLGEGGAAGFRVTVSCSGSTHAERNKSVEIYVLDALAEAGTYGTAGYVSRRLQAKVAKES